MAFAAASAWLPSRARLMVSYPKVENVVYPTQDADEPEQAPGGADRAALLGEDRQEADHEAAAHVDQERRPGKVRRDDAVHEAAQHVTQTHADEASCAHHERPSPLRHRPSVDRKTGAIKGPGLTRDRATRRVGALSR